MWRENRHFFFFGSEPFREALNSLVLLCKGCELFQKVLSVCARVFMCVCFLLCDITSKCPENILLQNPPSQLNTLFPLGRAHGLYTALGFGLFAQPCFNTVSSRVGEIQTLIGQFFISMYKSKVMSLDSLNLNRVASSLRTAHVVGESGMKWQPHRRLLKVMKEEKQKC